MMRWLAIAVLALSSTMVWAQLRTIPRDAKRGQIRHVQEMTVQVDGKRLKLAPGAQIRDADNRVVLPVAVRPGAPVKYRLDGEGMIGQLWLLSPQEAAQQERR
jgi:hypothetical protein